MHKKEIDGFIPSPSEVSRERKGEEDSGYEAHYFNYNEDEDHFICPEGKSLEFHREYVEDGRKYTSYHAKPADCVICTVRK